MHDCISLTLGDPTERGKALSPLYADPRQPIRVETWDTGASSDFRSPPQNGSPRDGEPFFAIRDDLECWDWKTDHMTATMAA